LSHDPILPFTNAEALAPEILLRLAEGLMASGAVVAVFTPQDELYFATPAFIELYDVQPGAQTFDSILRHCFNAQVGPLIESDDIDAWLRMANSRRRSKPHRRFEVDMIDGRWTWAGETVFGDGWIFLTITDFTFVKRKEFTLVSARDAAIVASETDDLTGLLNRGGVMRRFGRLVDTTPEGEGFSIVLMDLDHFKAINDRFGHDSGDQTLIHFADCARQVLRERDMLGRVGGEEFLLLMPGASQAQAGGVTERLQAHLRDQRLNLRGVSMRYTFSAGVAQWAPGTTLEVLYREADQALYAAKAGGRNQIRIAS
jgi:diguanylate cyclase (GGDEF)-like protein